VTVCGRVSTGRVEGFGSVPVGTGGGAVVVGGATVTGGTVTTGVVIGGVVTVGVVTVGVGSVGVGVGTVGVGMVGRLTVGTVTVGRPGGVSAVAAGTNTTAMASAARAGARLTSGKRRGRRMVAGAPNQLKPYVVGRSEDQDDWELSVETCRIDLWRGYVTSSFVARLSEGPEAGAVIETSSSFRWRGSRPRDMEEAKLAHYELVSHLKADGWSPNGELGEWYETELARPTLVPPREPEAAVDEPEPASDVAVVVVPPPRREPPEAAPLEREPAEPAFERSVPEPPPAQPEPAAAPAADQLPPPRRDRWRGAAVVGLLVAIVFLVVVATHS
jgi:hypothetical protein